MRVLLVNADAYSVFLLQVHLRTIDCRATVALTGLDGLRHATSEPFDLIILDPQLPDLNGLELCRLVRACQVTTPILVFTSQAQEHYKIAALDSGADDYVTKPCSTPELLARVRAHLRRVGGSTTRMAEAIKAPQPAASTTYYALRELELDTERRCVTVRGQLVDLTLKEFDLLALLVRNPGRPYTRSELMTQVWGYCHGGYGHTVNSHVNRLRLKIERDAAQPEYVLTVWSVGYKFSDS